MKILFLEPFFGGSHKEFALGFIDACPHDVTLKTMPDRFWKWRMRGAGLYFARHLSEVSQYDLIVATDMMDLTDFIGLTGGKRPPIWLYFHENQLSYPLAPGEKRDFHLGFTNIVSALAADRVFFNSHFHFNAFMADAQALVRKMPDYKPGWVLSKIEEKTRVIYPGCRFDEAPLPLSESQTDPPLIVWNHRWEHDKNPALFFDALKRLKQKGIPFFLAVLGENFEKAPAVFDQAKQWFEKELTVFGYLESKEAYWSWLKQGAIVVSCAFQENFGISVVEAVRYGCIPLLPKRLSYPEILPRSFHEACLYDSDSQFADRLEDMVVQFDRFQPIRQSLSDAMGQYAWSNVIRQYLDLFPSIKE